MIAFNSFILTIIPLVLLYIGVFPESLECRFLGGSVSWTKLQNKGVRFTYRLSFEYGTGPCGASCPPSSLNHLGTLPPELTSLSWKCTSGCSSPNLTLHDVNYYVTFADPNMGWEQGENLFFHTFHGNGPFEIRLDGLEWASDCKLGALTTTVELGERNDTGRPPRPNSSPIAASLGIVGIQLGCTSVIHIPVDDPDGDTVRCRLATNNECGQACTSVPNFKLDEIGCTMTIDTTSDIWNENGLYRVAMMIEDYPGYTIRVGNRISSIRTPISKIPYQFTIRVIKGPSKCLFATSKFVYPVYKDGFRFSYSGVTSKPLETAFYLQTSWNATYFAVSIPAGMTFSVKADDKNRTNVRRIKLSLRPDYLFRRGDQSGDNIICVWGVHRSGLMVSKKRCITALVNDFDECDRTGNVCVNNGTCINLYQHWTCKCPHGFKPNDCSHQVTCADFPCKNSGSCTDTGKIYVCSCAEGFTGPDCEHRINDSISTCIESNSHVHNRKKEVSIIPVALSVVGGLLCLLGLALCCCLWTISAHKKRKKKNRTSPEQDQIQNSASDRMVNNGSELDRKQDNTVDKIVNNDDNGNMETVNRSQVNNNVGDSSSKKIHPTPILVKSYPTVQTIRNSLTAFSQTGSQRNGGIRRLQSSRSNMTNTLKMPDVEEIQGSSSRNIYTTTMKDPLMHQTGVKMSR